MDLLNKNYIGEGLKPVGPNLNVLNVLRTLIDSDDCKVFIPKEYERISKKKIIDPSMHFYPDRCLEARGIESNQEAFNYSLMGEIKVAIEVKDKDTDTVNLEDKYIFRKYNFIRNGELYVNKFYALLSEDAFENLKSAGLLWYSSNLKVIYNHNYKSNYIYLVDMSSIPVVSLNWAQPVNIGLYEMLMEEVEQTEFLKLLRKRIKELKENINVEPQYNSRYYNEKYIGLEDSKNDNKLTLNCVRYTLPGYKAKDYSDEVNSINDYYEADRERKSRESYLRRLRFMSRSVIFAIEKSSKKGSFEWGEEQKMKGRSTKMFSDCTVKDKSGNEHVLRRVTWDKEV